MSKNKIKNNMARIETLGHNELERKVSEVLERGVVDVIDREHLIKRMLSGETLRVKLGIDPTGPNLHIGRGSTIKKLREFQELGHQIVLIIGDATAQIGDASDKFSPRQMLAREKIAENERNYLDQIGRIIDLSKTEVHHNSEWIDELIPGDWIRLASLFSVQQMLSRDNFAERLKRDNPIGWHEGLYCLLQGWDSVKTRADVEIGGSDQLFNLHAGRKIQEYFGQEPQDIVTLQLLAGTDGRKMSTSWGNVILIVDPPKEKFGKIMRISDHLIPTYLECATLVPMQRVSEIERALEEGHGNPMDYKKELAYEIVKFYNGEEAAQFAQKHFEKTTQAKQIPDNIPTLQLSTPELSLDGLLRLLVQTNMVKSKSEARRLLEQGGLYVEGNRIDREISGLQIPEDGITIQVGKRRFIRLTR